MQTRKMPLKPQWLRANFTGNVVKVDRTAKVLRGYVLAQIGPFKTPGRGEFNLQGLKKIEQLANDKNGGLKSRFGHPTLSDDGIGKFLGRAKDTWMDNNRAVRGDLYFDETAFNTPHGNLAGYVMDLAEKDPDAISSSLVIDVDEEYRLDAKGKPLTDKDGTDLPPLWHPKALHASDIVDTGDAVDGLLSVDGLPDAAVRRGMELLDQTFKGQSREVIEARATAWLQRYLTHRFGEDEADELMEQYREKLKRNGLVLDGLKKRGAA